MERKFFSKKWGNSSKLATKGRSIKVILPNSMLAIIFRLLVNEEPLRVSKGAYDGDFRDIAALAEDMCYLFYGFKYVFDNSSGYIIFSLDPKRVDDLKKNLLKYFDKVIKNEINSRSNPFLKWEKLNEVFLKSLEERLLNSYPFSSLEYMHVILYEYLIGRIKVYDVDIRFCRDFDKDGSSRVFGFQSMSCKDVNDDFIKINANVDLSHFANSLYRLEDENNAENMSQIENLKKDFKLSDTEVIILRVCKFLMDTSLEAVTNKVISNYLAEINFPVSEGVIKQCVMAIKNKCGITSTRGTTSLVLKLQQEGYLIPPLEFIKNS